MSAMANTRFDSYPSDPAIDTYLAELSAAPTRFCVSKALHAAAQIVEFSAFEGARVMPAEAIAHLINMSAELSAHAERVTEGSAAL